jgi:hypothetical protein
LAKQAGLNLLGDLTAALGLELPLFLMRAKSLIIEETPVRI